MRRVHTPLLIWRVFFYVNKNLDSAGGATIMRITSLGSYPKIATDHGPSVRAAIQRFERQGLSATGLDQVYRDVTQRVLTIAAESRLDLTTDGLIRWNDMFDAVVRDVENVASGGLLRLLDNNFYYRHPVIRGRLSYQGGVLRWWLQEAQRLSSVPLKAVLPGPLTFLKLAEDDSYRNRGRLLSDLVEVLRLEAQSLRDIGLAEIQWDEPALAYYPDWNVAEVRDALGALIDGAEIPQAVALYWGPTVHSWLEPLSQMGFDRIYCDAVSDPKVLPYLEQHALSCQVGLGLIDARQVSRESVSGVARAIERVLAVQGNEKVWLHPNGGLELLPPDRAEDKLRLLAGIRDVVEGRPEGGLIS